MTERGILSDDILPVSRTVSNRASVATKCLLCPVYGRSPERELWPRWGTWVASGPHIQRRTGSGLRARGGPPWGSTEGLP